MEYYVATSTPRSRRHGNGGAMHMPDGVPPEAPSMWVVYFAVDDCDASADRVHAAGRRALHAADGDGTGQRFAGATDPTGAMFFFGSFPGPPDGVAVPAAGLGSRAVGGRRDQ